MEKKKKKREKLKRPPILQSFGKKEMEAIKANIELLSKESLHRSQT